MISKETNPKDGIGVKKWRQYATVPMTVIWQVGVAMLEGALKYRRHNYRVAGVRAAVYYDAAKGHIDQWWEGENLDPDSGLPHLVKAIASLVVLQDGINQGLWTDDRPPKTVKLDLFRDHLQAKVDTLFERYGADAQPPYTEVEHGVSSSLAKRPYQDTCVHGVEGPRYCKKCSIEQASRREEKDKKNED